MGWGGSERFIQFDWEQEGVGWGWAIIRGWALITFFCLQDGCLFEVGANARLGAYSNKDGASTLIFISGIVYYKVL